MRLQGKTIHYADARMEFARILLDEMGSCNDRGHVLEYPTIMAGWTEAPWYVTWKLIKLFVHDDDLRERIAGAVAGVERFWLDLAKINAAAGGAPMVISRAIVDEQKRRVILAMFPHVREVCYMATRRPEIDAANAIREYIGEEDRWVS